MVQTLKLLKKLRKENKISTQEYRTYRGQVLSGNVEACRLGLKRKNLLKEGEY